MRSRADSSSPCADRGLNQDWMSTALDLAGNPRRARTVDMGAYEVELQSPKGAVFMLR